MENSSIVSVK